ncbi:hypothetical protein Tco_1114781, partial [Tanacetum coccineum]
FDYREESETEEESGQSEKKVAMMTKIGTLKDMGFGSFIGYKINRVPTALARWLLLNYDPRTSVLEAGDVKIKITSQTVHDIFGLPMGGKEIVELNQAKKTDEVIEEWRVHFKGLATIKPSDVAKRILEREDDAGRIFKLNFLVLFVTQMMNSTKCGTVNQTFLTCLKKGMDIKKLDWCGYLLKCLKRTKMLWKGGHFNGPSTFLTVLYAQKCMPIVLKRSSTSVITKWTTRKLIMLQKTDIETHEIKAAETTPEKERMTKSKIIAAKNVVTASGLCNKLTMLEVLMNGIACDLEKAIQQHPGDEEIENIKLQWKEKLLKIASKMNVKDKERPCEQIFEADRGMEVEGEKNNHEMEDLEKTDAHKTIDADKQGASRLKDVNKSEFDAQFDPVKVVCTMEEPSSVLPANDIPSFDLGLTPTPPDVNVNADKQDVSNEVVCTMEEPSSVLPANDIPSFDLGLTPTPPDVNVNADKQDVSNEEPILDIVPLTFTRISAKLRLPQKKAKDQESTTIASATNTSKFEVVSNYVKDRSSVLLLNDAPSFDLGLTPTPPDVNLHTDTEPMLENEPVKKNEKELGPTNTISAFDVVPLSFAMPNATLVTPAIEKKELNDKESMKMKQTLLEVFFPVLLAKCHYYLLVFNLKTPKIEILDNSKNGINVSVDDLYGESFKKLKKLFIEYLAYSEHRSWKSMKKLWYLYDTPYGDIYGYAKELENVDLRMRMEQKP